ncbi:MAG: hypothetical protein A2075_12050 [Geobacteraceae bacterium GWC2_58_44]|nr:MAG: hypothetical protein A2075_12050 [Geobacteraceae bacterium GWC2_58_44]HBG06295.1 hypothetical protein [Geobacter sp.]
MTKADIAVEGMIKRIGTDPRLAYLVGPATQTYMDLTDAYAEIKGVDPDVFRQSFEAALQVQRLPARKDIPARKSQTEAKPQPRKEQKSMKTAQVAIEVPAGFRQNGKGHLVPEHLISPVEQMTDDLVTELAAKWRSLSETIAEFKQTTFGDVHALLGTINEEFQVKKGGEKGNVQLFSYNGGYKLLVAVNEKIGVGPELQACLEKIRECVQVWKEGAKPELIVLLDELLAPNGKGSVSIGKLLEVKRYKFDSDDWRMAMKALDESLRVVGSKQYLRLYERNESGAYIAIPLDIAAL